MLRYKAETRPGLVALYDIRPETAAGQFLQPRSPHGAHTNGHLEVSQRCVVQNVLSLRVVEEMSFI